MGTNKTNLDLKNHFSISFISISFVGHNDGNFWHMTLTMQRLKKLQNPIKMKTRSQNP